MYLEKIVKDRIDNYIGFDSDDIFKVADISVIFGGAIRDSIAGLEIHDVDIACGSNSCKIIRTLLEKCGYRYVSNLNGKDFTALYNDINIINEPHTFILRDRIIQLIRPAIGNMESYSKNVQSLINNVDISACGVGYNGNIVKEHCEDAIYHCKNRIFKMLPQNLLYHKRRADNRRYKLEDRGWKNIDDIKKDQYTVDRNIYNILNG